MSEAMGSSELRIEGLTGAQETALAALRAGGTFVRAAEEAGVSRVTVYRWVRDDPHFQAAYNAWQQEAAESARARLVKLADKAVDVVERALGRNDEKVALKVLRGVGVLRKGRKESTNAEVLGLKIKVRDGRELQRAERGMLHHLMKKMGMPARERKRVLAGGRGASEFLDGVRQELEHRERGEQTSHDSPSQNGMLEPTASPGGFGGAGGSGNVTSPEPEAEARQEAQEQSTQDNPIDEREMRWVTRGPEGSPGDVTSDVTPGGMLHESVA